MPPSRQDDGNTRAPALVCVLAVCVCRCACGHGYRWRDCGVMLSVVRINPFFLLESRCLKVATCFHCVALFILRERSTQVHFRWSVHFTRSRNLQHVLGFQGGHWEDERTVFEDTQDLVPKWPRHHKEQDYAMADVIRNIGCPSEVVLQAQVLEQQHVRTHINT